MADNATEGMGHNICLYVSRRIVHIFITEVSCYLLQALNFAFGWEYYSLGILKLLADGFGFAGPLLLNQLVSFIEKKTEAEYYGYLYALGLLLATFFGTICSTQFDYNSQVG